MRARGMPLSLSICTQLVASAAALAGSANRRLADKTLVDAPEPMRARSTPMRNARSPPVWTSGQ
jgi:hypothetical protein